MSYTKTNWTKGDVITAEKLNKMEDGIEQASSGGGSNEFLIPVTARAEGMTEVYETTMPFMMIRTAYEAGKDLALDVTDDNGNRMKLKLTYAIGGKTVPGAANIDIIKGIIFIGFSGTTGTIRSIDIAAENGDTNAAVMRSSIRTFSVANPGFA